MNTGRQDTGGTDLPGDDEEFALRILERTVTGDGSPADEAMLAAWIGDDPQRQHIVDRLRSQWGTVPEAHDVDEGWARISPRLRPSVHRAEEEPAPAVRRHVRPLTVVPVSRRSPFRAVAAGALAASIAIAAFWLGTSPRPASERLAPRVYATPVGQQVDIRLPDGTQMRIAPESRVRLAADFGAQRRDVYVEGEAYFEVTHDTSRPFTVFAGNTSTRDIGTAFAVRSYAEEGAVRVVVTEGKVVMSGAGLLAAGDVGRLTADGIATVQRKVDVAPLIGWTHGELMFEDAPLAQVLQDLRRWYGIDVRLADSALKALPFTGSLRGASAAQGVELVAATLGLRLTYDKNRTVLYER